MKKIIKLLILLFLVTGFWILSTTILSAQMSNEGDGDVTLLCPECGETGGGDDDGDGNTGNGGNGPNPGNGGGGDDPNEFYWDGFFDAVDNDPGDSYTDPTPIYTCPLKLTSETKATEPSDRARTTIAIGEEVTVTVPSSCPALSNSWGLRQDFGTNGFKVSKSEYSYTFNAGTVPGKLSVILTLTGSSGNLNCAACPNEISLDFNVICPRLISKTVATSPSDRARTKVGIGEDIEILLLGGDGCDGSPTWSINNLPGTTLTPMASYSSGIIKAGDIPGKFEVSVDFGAECNASCPEKEYKKEFEVIQPNGVFYEAEIDPTVCPNLKIHNKNTPSLAYYARYYLMPDNVNFYNVMVKEGDTKVTCSGPYFPPSGPPCPLHEPNPEYRGNSDIVIPGKGTKSEKLDGLGFFLVCRSLWDPKLAGFIKWEIDLEYERVTPTGSTAVPFCKIVQSGENAGGTNSLFTVKKGNETQTSNLEEADSCPPYPPCN